MRPRPPATSAALVLAAVATLVRCADDDPAPPARCPVATRGPDPSHGAPAEGSPDAPPPRDWSPDAPRGVPALDARFAPLAACPPGWMPRDGACDPRGDAPCAEGSDPLPGGLCTRTAA